jgi:diaminohydroxyphosphoribosylaminopyrimidine deaminase / 5-amino-6-(5-phosphoribosylamino)uracil reductase
MFSATDHEWMSLALQQAELGLYSTSPNPRVGCVIVKDNQIIGQGAHLKAGEAHAEVMALCDAQSKYPEKIQGATAYVTLEPCSHFGRTPPCADALINAGIQRVVAAMQDPNPQVAGNGLARLSAAGIRVEHGLMEVQARTLNTGFISRMLNNKPFVRLKIAASLDGRTALANGESKWITNEYARADVHHWRARSCAILTGIGTVLADNPHMNVRNLNTNRQPLRVVVDSALETPINANILKDGETLIAYANAPATKIASLEQAGARLIHLPNTDGKVCLASLMKVLAARGINELMVEAGQKLNGALIAADCVDELLLYYAPVLLGSDGQGMLTIPTLASMQDRIQLNIFDVRQFGSDIRIRANIKSPPIQK